MYTVCFVVLLAVSAGALVQSLVWAVVPRNFDRIKSIVGLYAEFAIWAALSTALVIWSSLSAVKYAILAFMFVSLALDFRYYRRVIRLKRQGRLHDAPGRRRWPIADNAAWVAAVLVLYFA